MYVVRSGGTGTLKNGEVFEWNIPGYVFNRECSSKRSDLFIHSSYPDFKFCLTLIPYIKYPSKRISFHLQLHRIPVSNWGSSSRSGNFVHLFPEMDVRFILYKTESVYKWSCSLRMQDNQVTAVFPEISTYDSMTVQCIIMPDSPKKDDCSPQEVSILHQNASGVPEESHTLALDMSALLNSGNFADVVLCVEDKEFSVHRCILASRSDVFAAMFNHDTREKKEKRIVIVDFSSDVVFQLLKYIYTDQIGELTPDQYLSLYSAADKYAVTDLRKKCAQELRKCLPVNAVIHVLVTADLHQDDDLKEAGLQMFLKNAVSVMSSEEWLPFMQNHTQLASSVLMHLAKKSSGQ